VGGGYEVNELQKCANFGNGELSSTTPDGNISVNSYTFGQTNSTPATARPPSFW